MQKNTPCFKKDHDEFPCLSGDDVALQSTENKKEGSNINMVTLYTWPSDALPPTSTKLADVPPCNLIISMVAMANPAPFTSPQKKGLKEEKWTDAFEENSTEEDKNNEGGEWQAILYLPGVFLSCITQGKYFFLSKCSIIIKVQLCISSNKLVVSCLRKRIYLSTLSIQIRRNANHKISNQNENLFSLHTSSSVQSHLQKSS